MTLKPGLNEYSFRSESGDLINYLLFVPTGFDPEVNWPVIIYLHGYAGLGEKLVTHADEPLLELLATEDESRFVVVSPQLPEGFWPKYFERVEGLITHLARHLPVDNDRLYLTGFSIGGPGAWRSPLSYPNRLAAVAPVAGAPSPTARSLPDDLCNLNDLPMWVLNSDADTEFIADADVAAVEALEACGGEVRFSRYSDLAHVETALEAYGDSDLSDWFIERSK